MAAVGNFGEYHAVVIGNNNYEDLSDLKSASADARAVAQFFLTSMFGIVYQWLIDPGQEREIENLHNNLKITMHFLLLPQNTETRGES